MIERRDRPTSDRGCPRRRTRRALPRSSLVDHARGDPCPPTSLFDHARRGRDRCRGGVPGLLGPRRIVSTLSGGAFGPLAVSDVTATQLLAAALRRTWEAGVRRLEIKQVPGVADEPAPAYPRQIGADAYDQRRLAPLTESTVIASPAGCICEVVGAGVMGPLASGADAADLAGRRARLLKDNPYLCCLAAAERERGRWTCSFDATLDRSLDRFDAAAHRRTLT